MALEFVVNGVTVADGGSGVLPARTVASVPAETVTIRAVGATDILAIRDKNTTGITRAGRYLELVSVPVLPLALADTDTTTIDVQTTGRVVEGVPELGHFFRVIEVDYDDSSIVPTGGGGGGGFFDSAGSAAGTQTATVLIRQTVSDPAFAPPTISKADLFGSRFWGYYNIGGQSGELGLHPQVVAGGHINYVQTVIQDYVDWCGVPCQVVLWMPFGRAGAVDHGGDLAIDAWQHIQDEASDPILWNTWGEAAAALDAMEGLERVRVYHGSHRKGATLLAMQIAEDWAGWIARYMEALRPYYMLKKAVVIGVDAARTRTGDVSPSNPDNAPGEARYELTDALRRIMVARGGRLEVEPRQKTDSPFVAANGFGVYEVLDRLELTLPDWRLGVASGTESAAATAAVSYAVAWAGLDSSLEVNARAVAHVLAMSELTGHAGYDVVRTLAAMIAAGVVTSDDFAAEVQAALLELGS